MLNISWLCLNALPEQLELNSAQTSEKTEDEETLDTTEYDQQQPEASDMSPQDSEADAQLIRQESVENPSDLKDRPRSRSNSRCVSHLSYHYSRSDRSQSRRSSIVEEILSFEQSAPVAASPDADKLRMQVKEVSCFSFVKTALVWNSI